MKHISARIASPSFEGSSVKVEFDVVDLEDLDKLSAEIHTRVGRPHEVVIGGARSVVLFWHRLTMSEVSQLIQGIMMMGKRLSRMQFSVEPSNFRIPIRRLKEGEGS